MKRKSATIGEFAGWNTEAGRKQFDEAFATMAKMLGDPATQEALERINNAPEAERNAWLPKPAQD